jgi:hypothetical protein
MPQELVRFAVSTKVQQISAVIATREFLARLCTPSAMPRVSREIRGEARALLRHYPSPGVLRPILESGLEVARSERNEQAMYDS